MNYIKPTIKTEEAEAARMMAVSIIDGGSADPEKPVLTKEDKDWEIWNDDAE